MIKKFVHTMTGTPGATVLAGLFRPMAAKVSVKTINRISLIVIGLPVLGLVMPCYAQCGGGRPVHTGLTLRPGHAQLVSAAFALIKDDEWGRENPAIVGFWHQQLISEGSNGKTAEL